MTEIVLIGPAARTRQRQQQNQMAVNHAPPAAAALNADHLPGPGLFCGQPEERGQDWLQNFELWSRCRAYDDNVKVAALALHLRDAAATWHHVLPDNEKDTWPHIRASFLARYGPNLQAGWQKASQIWTQQQLPGESVLDYIAKMQRFAGEINLPIEQQHFAVINGLRPNIRSHVLRQNPANLAQLRQAALLAEQTDNPSDDNSLAIQRIERQLQQLTLHSLQEPVDRPRPAERRYDELRRGPSRSPSIDRRPAEHQRFDPSSSRYASSRSPSTDRRRPTENYLRRDERTDRRPARLATPVGQHRVSFDNSRVSSYDRREPREANYPPCLSCGRNNHRRSDCYFRNAVCTSCDRSGHTTRACKSARH